MEASADGWDVVLRGGRVIDPESGLDAVRDVAVANGRIAAVGTGLTAKDDIDVAGQVVTAGFIDLHSHVSDLGGLRLQAMDGVTTALELEAGVTPVAQAYRRAADEGRPINYGFAASWALARMEAVARLPPDASLGAFMARISDPAWQRPAGPVLLQHRRQHLHPARTRLHPQQRLAVLHGLPVRPVQLRHQRARRLGHGQSVHPVLNRGT